MATCSIFKESNLDSNIQKFISILRQFDYSSYIGPQKELICFCERNFHMTDLYVIEQVCFILFCYSIIYVYLVHSSNEFLFTY